jgi:hypothetical protein
LRSVQSTGQEATVLTTRSIHSTAVMAFACLALLVFTGPAAAAQQPPDMHASVAMATAKSQQQQDLRSPDAADIPQPNQDMRSPDAADVPTQPIEPVPSVHAVSDTSDGMGWLTIALGIAGSLLLLGGMVAIVVHGRRVGRVHVSA